MNRLDNLTFLSYDLDITNLPLMSHTTNHPDESLLQGISYPNIRLCGMLVIGWLCFGHSSGVVRWIGFFDPIYSPFFYFLNTNGANISLKIE
mgnify:CR=1 FL=1